jgi:hypothetical protein
MRPSLSAAAAIAGDTASSLGRSHSLLLPPPISIASSLNLDKRTDDVQL